MQPELVLTEEEKKERFKVSINRKTQDEDIAETSYLHPSVPTTSTVNSRPDSRGLVGPFSPTRGQAMHERAAAPSTSSASMSPYYEDEFGQEYNRADVFGHDVGLSNNAIEYETETETNMVNTTTGIIYSDAPKRVSVIQRAATKPYHAYLCKPVEDADTERCNETGIGGKEDLDSDLGGKFEAEISCPDSEIILKYIHKKFGKGKHKQKSNPEEILAKQSSGLDSRNR